LLGGIDQMIKTALVDSYFAFYRCGLLLGRIDQIILNKLDAPKHFRDVPKHL